LQNRKALLIKKTLIFLLTLSALFVYSAPEDILKSIQQKMSRANTITADFIQIKKSDIFRSSIKSYGKFYMKKPSLLRWEFLKPVKSLLIINKNDLIISDDSGVRKIDISSASSIKSVLYNIFFWFDNTKSKLNNNFHVKSQENRLYYTINLKPKSKSIKKFFSKIIISFLKTSGVIKKIVLKESVTSDSVTITFSNIKIGVIIPDRYFKIK
jgi:outer membrane lipoprotein carrier protein